MGFERLSGVQWTCDNINCGKQEIAPDQQDVDGTLIAPKGWLVGNVREATGQRGDEPVAATYIACKITCVGKAATAVLDRAHDALQQEEGTALPSSGEVRDG